MSSIVISGDSSGAITLAAPSVAGTNTATLPAATGTVMVSGNMPAFSAYAATVTTVLTANTDTKVSFDTKIFDTNSNFSSSRFTPTVAGYYQINAAVGLPYWTGVIYCVAIYKSGSVYQYGQSAYPQSTGAVRASISSVVYCNGSTDYIEIYGYQYNASSSNTTQASQTGTWFSGCLVRAA